MGAINKGIFYKIFKGKIDGLIEVYKSDKIRLEEKVRFNFLKELQIDALIDIGANEGQFSARVKRIYPEIPIFAFEPLSLAYNILSTTFKNDQSVKAYNYALGNTNEVVKILLSDYTPSSSILSMKPSHPNLFEVTQSGKTEEIEIKKLNDFKNEFVNYKSLCLKIDVQGFEEQVICGGDEILQKTNVIIIETSFVELYESQTLFSDIYKLLKNHGFSFHGTFDQLYSNKLPFPVQADSIFIKQDLSF